MARMSMVYDGQVAGDLTKEELIKAILREYKVTFDENTNKAMGEAFRCGFLHGEDFAKDYYPATEKADTTD